MTLTITLTLLTLYQSHLYHVVSLSTCIVFFIFLMFDFVIVLHALSISTVYMHTGLLRVILNINQSINVLPTKFQPLTSETIQQLPVKSIQVVGPRPRTRNSLTYFAQPPLMFTGGQNVRNLVSILNPSRPRSALLSKRSNMADIYNKLYLFIYLFKTPCVCM